MRRKMAFGIPNANDDAIAKVGRRSRKFEIAIEKLLWENAFREILLFCEAFLGWVSTEKGWVRVGKVLRKG